MTVETEDTIWSDLLYAFSHFLCRITLFKRGKPHNLGLDKVTFRPHISVSVAQDNCSLFS